MLLCFPTQDCWCLTNSPKLCNTLVTKAPLEHGPLSAALSDRDKHFLNDLVAATEDLFIVRHAFSSGYRPQTAGTAERVNQTGLRWLAARVERHQTGCDQLLPYVLFAYRSLHRPTIKDVPSFFLHGYEPTVPHQPHELPAHINQPLAESERSAVRKRSVKFVLSLLLL